MLRLSARWALPIDAAPLADAAVLADDAGRIAAVGPDASVPRPLGALTLDLGDAILLPGLVNSHTHLELTGLEMAAPETEFPAWIRRIRALKQARSAEEYLAAARRGIRDCWAAGITTIAETGDSGAVFAALLEMGGSGIVYHEVFGPHPEQLQESFALLSTTVAMLRPRATERVRLGVSPHAPYTVGAPLYRAVAEWARQEQLPMAVHLAESRAETALVTGHHGPFAEAWATRGIPPIGQHHPPSGGAASRSRAYRSPVDYVDTLGVLGPDTLCIHAVQIDARDIRTLADRGAGVAHCPISNRSHGHGDAPLAALRAAGIRVGVGTDSVVSVGRLDLLAEAREARRLGSLEAGEALELVTLGAARSLGVEGDLGSLTPGKWADLAVFDPGPGFSSPEEAALAAGPDDTIVTVVSGRVVHRGTGRGRPGRPGEVPEPRPAV